MERKTTVGFMLLLLVIFASDGSMKRTEARECRTPSRTFKGLCLSDKNCESVCNTEGFTGGKCEDMAVKRTEGRECWTQSKTFHGLCFSDRNCETVCLTEGFTGGKCKGFRHRCFCSELC
ncbi:hypothetical protein V8G54_001996 [Vigna mungo]|uniref:Knottins-like domain-containing protein n=1 Tax=Vigna mungo TaxID=3915 RepID=A0AAQ3PAH5_VIGMU